MAITAEQSAVNGSFGADAAATFGSTPIAGNFLIAIAAHRGGDIEPSITSGGASWSASVHSKYEVANSSARRMETMWWKIAGGSEPTSITTTGLSGITNSMAIAELDLDGLELEYQATNTNSNVTTATASLLSGALTPDVVPALAISSLIWRDLISALSFDSSYTKIIENLGSGSGQGQAMSFKELSAGSTSTTASWTTSVLAGHALHLWRATVETQTIHPASDVTRVDWVDEGAGTTNLWDGLDETSTNDSDYITVSV